MKPRKYFPLGKAYGAAFCNRVQETKWLAGNLTNAKHSLLIAPRRYGKSSLAEHAIAKTKLPFVKINFHLCTTEEEVAQLIVSNVTSLIGQAVGQVEKVITSIKKYASNLRPKLTFGDKIATLELIPKQQINQAVVISEVLMLVESLLREKKKKAVIFFDEFQEIAKINAGTSIEGAIRTAAQEMQNLSIIFSGSIRSLLMRLFESEERPLYKLCRKIKLNRISALDYKKHINKIAVETWNQALEESVFNEIMLLSNQHPYYVNYLCDTIWGENDTLPKIKDVRRAWLMVVEEEWSDALREIASLSLSQRKVLKFIATHEIRSISSHETYMALMMPASTVNSTVGTLIEKDYVETDDTGCYKIINPLLATVLADHHLG